MAQRTYSTHEAARLTGEPYHRIDKLARKRVVEPSVMATTGTGRPRRYDLADLLAIAATSALREAGLPFEALRGVQEVLRAGNGENLDSIGEALLVVAFPDEASAHEAFPVERIRLVRSAEDAGELAALLAQGARVFTVLRLRDVVARLKAEAERLEGEDRDDTTIARR